MGGRKMHKKILGIFVATLMIVTLFASMMVAEENKNAISFEYTGPVSEVQSDQNVISRSIWDIQFNYNVGSLASSNQIVGAEFDGTHFYCTNFSSSSIYKFDINGNYLGTISIPGVTGLIGLAYDGTYFYGSTQANPNSIYKMNFDTQTLIGTITSPVASWNIAYDEDADSGNGGFWVGQWGNAVTLIDRSGTTLDTLTHSESMLGMAWDDVSSTVGYTGPFLWIFTGTSTGMDGIIKQFDLATKTLTGVTRNVATDIAPGIAGGLFFTTEYDSGTATLGGILQGDVDDLLFGYEICPTVVYDNDVGAISINSPTGTHDMGSYTVNATIKNFGNLSQTTPVNCSIYNSTGTLVYGADTTVFVSNGTTAFVEFSPSWSVSLEGDYLINVTTQLPGDESNVNNATEGTVTIHIYTDVGTTSINSPAAVIPPGSTTVNATIENFGSQNQTVPVNCSIYESGGGYFADFESDDGGWVASASWDPVGDWEWTDSYDFGSYSGANTPPPAAYSGDGLWATVPHGDYTNSGGYNYLSQTFDFTGFTNAEISWYNWCDVFYSFDTSKLFVEGVEKWDWGTSTPSSDWSFETVDLSAWDGQASVEIVFELYATTVVEKAGWYIDDVTIGSNLTRAPGDLVYTKETTVNVSAFSTAYVEFMPAWNAPTGNYTVKIKTMLPGDEDINNDRKNQDVSVIAAADVGATTVNYPTGEKRPGEHIVNATIENFGSVDQTTPVNCSIYNSTHALVYGADASVFVSSMGTAYVEFSPPWNVSTEGIYLINVTTRLPGDECDINNATEATVTIEADIYLGDVQGRWNFISLPFNQSIDKTDLFLCHNGTDYNWTEAIDPANGPLIDSFIFGWNRGLSGQVYQAVDVLEPGYGYWMYAYSDCELWITGISVPDDNFITNIEQKWNTMGIPYDQSVDKTNLTIQYNGTDYSWTEAIDPANGPLIDSFIFGWNRGPSGQIYQAVDTLEPGYSYWMYAYYDCTLQRS
jgi:hypothetical protein